MIFLVGLRDDIDEEFYFCPEQLLSRWNLFEFFRRIRGGFGEEGPKFVDINYTSFSTITGRVLNWYLEKGILEGCNGGTPEVDLLFCPKRGS